MRSEISQSVKSEIVRLKDSGNTYLQIAESTGIARSTVAAIYYTMKSGKDYASSKAKQRPTKRIKKVNKTGVHDLSNRSIYPSYHKYISSESINVYTPFKIEIGEFLIVKGRNYKVTKFLSTLSSSHYEGCFYQELSIEKVD